MAARGSLARWAARRVDEAHVSALAADDPVAFLRARQAEAERQYARSGDARDLALVRAYADSLDGPPTAEEGVAR